MQVFHDNVRFENAPHNLKPVQAMKSTNNKRILHLLGILIISFWCVMIGLLYKRLESGGKASGNTYQTETEIDSAQKEWKEIFLKDRKVGYSISFIRPFEQGYFIQDEVFLRLNLLGLDNGIYTITQAKVDDKFVLKDFTFKMHSGIVSYDLSGVVKGDRLLIKTGHGKAQNTRQITLSAPPVISAGIEHLFKTRRLHVGDIIKAPFFDPSTMIQKEGVFKVAARETLIINKIEYAALRLETEIFGNSMTIWVDESGVILKEQGLMGLVMLKSSAANASRNIEAGEDDFYDLAALPVEKELRDKDKLTYLKLKIDMTDNAELPKLPGGTNRQSMDHNVMIITREKIPFQPGQDLNNLDNTLKPYLSPEFNIESDADEIIAKAKAITGDEKNPVAKAGKLMKWVYNNIDKRPVISIPSALEVLKTKVGDCNEHATLLTALLRASGIPARLSVGLVYNRGKFYYHAWTEAYIGGWITMDATLNQMPADVTHICLVSGNLDKQVEIMGLIGRLKLEVLDFGYN
jgi:hypothetical protein